MRKILAMFGTPGAGKSTIARRLLTMGSHWEQCEPVKLVRAHVSESLNLCVIGRYVDGDRYGGVDCLAMNCQPSVEKFVAETTMSVFVEGDRLSNAKFYRHLRSLEVPLEIICLSVDRLVVFERQQRRGDDRTEKFLRSRETKYENLRRDFNVTTLSNDDLVQHEIVWRRVTDHLEVRRV